jgi:large subunit ribosomal protein L9
MEIILIEDVPKLGDMGEVVQVKPGFARNYLIPQRLAVRADSRNKSQLNHQRRIIDARRIKLASEAETTRSAIDQISVTLPKRSGDGDKLFGSVTNRDIAAVLRAAGHEVNPKKILLDGPIKELGIFTVHIKLHADIVAGIRVWVVSQ